MSVFDEIKNLLFGEFSEWIQIRDYKSSWTIEDFPYETGVDEKLTSPHYWKCVTVNQCWFKNEKDKKPEEFDYFKYSIVDIPLLKRGLYHPKCHCKKKGLNQVTSKNVQLIIPIGKIEWMKKDKGHLLNSMGYRDKDFSLAIEIIQKLVKEEYCQGNYSVRIHDRTGFKISLLLKFPGINEDNGKIYFLKTGWSIFPNGKLKCNTLIGGLKK